MRTGAAIWGRVQQAEEGAGRADTEEEAASAGEAASEGGPGWATLLGQRGPPLDRRRRYGLLGEVGLGDAPPNSKKPFAFFFGEFLVLNQ